MSPEQFLRAGELFHAALELAPETRADFLAKACVADDELLREVESLLAARAQADGFIVGQVAGVVAELVAQRATPSLVGQSLSHYQVLSLLGAGGMGEVYAAQDTRLGRKVALKLLPAAFAQNTERLRRFEQEALAASALNHPNILTVYDIGTAPAELGGAPFIVAELLEGEELRKQLKAGPLPVRKAIEYARQLAAGLTAAHDKGVVHRDLKPENLFITNDGLVKILDFGLAKLRPQLSEQSGATKTAQAQITNPGTVMGTVGYMSPEQVRGQEADHRADIFSFGLILYEMLAGRPAFEGESSAETMAAIAKEEPPELSESNPKISPQLERLVARCLEKQPARRFQTASDLGFALEAFLTPSGSRLKPESGPAEAATSTPAPRRNRREHWWMAVAGLGLLLAAGFAWAYFTRPAAQLTQPLTLSLTLPEQAKYRHFALSPDGTRLAFTTAVGVSTQLWTLALATGEARLLAGSEGARHPFWSPDSRFIGFFTADKLNKIEAAGGLPTTLCAVRLGNGGSWNRAGVIIFGTVDGGELLRVSATGGVPTTVLFNNSKRQELVLRFPSFLPDGTHFLYSIASNNKEVRGIYLGSLTGNVRERLVGDYSNALYAPAVPGKSETGYLLFGHEKGLVAQPFNARTFQLGGEPVTVAAQIATTLNSVYRNFSASENGVLVFDADPQRQQKQTLWVDRGGKTLNVLKQLDDIRAARLAPDGRRFVASNYDLATNNFDLWLSDVTSGNTVRFTFDAANDSFPVWSPDASRIVWAANRERGLQLYEKAVQANEQEKPLLQSAHNKTPTDWSLDGRFIIYHQSDDQTQFDLWALPLRGEPKPFPLVQSAANESGGVLSPDGRWLAYHSDETGRYEVYVQNFPGSGGKQRVSTGGGVWPFWRGDGKELYYRALDDKLMVAPVRGQTLLAVSPPTALFEFRSGGLPDQPFYAVDRAGQHFLLNTIVEAETQTPLTVLVNWAAVLKN